MEELRKLQEVRDAYEKASFWNLIKCAYKVSMRRVSVPLWILTITSFVSILVTAAIRNNFAQIITTVLMLSTALLLVVAIRIVFKNYYQEYPDLLEAYKKNRIFLRYLIFKSNLPVSMIGNKPQIDEIIKIIQFEKSLTEINIFFKHPVTVVCLGLLTAIIGGAASQLSAWSSGVMVLTIIALLIIIFFNYQITDIFQPKSYKDKELEQFLVWLSIDK